MTDYDSDKYRTRRAPPAAFTNGGLPFPGSFAQSAARGPFRVSRTLVAILIGLNLLGWMVYSRWPGGGGDTTAPGVGGGVLVTLPGDGRAETPLLNIQVVRLPSGEGGETPVEVRVSGGAAVASTDARSPVAPEPRQTGGGQTELLPAHLSLADFTLTQAQKDELLATIPIEDFSTLGEHVRTFFQLHARLRALEDWQLGLDRAPGAEPVREPRRSTSTHAALDDFRRFMATFETKLFRFVRPTYPSVSHLYRSFARGPRTRGMVLTAGNGQVRMALVAIQSIRAAGCRLPIEIMYAGDGDLSPESRQRLLSMGDGYDVVARDITLLMDNDVAKVRGWAIKPFAIMFSSFTEVVFQDSDVVWFGSPEEVLEDPVYQETGTLFYFDRRTLFGISDGMYKFALSILPKHLRDPVPPHMLAQNSALAKQSAHQQESGVVAVDKSRAHNFYGLLTSCKMNLEEERDKVVYKHIYGDKETFWMGWEMAGQTGRYGWSPWPVAQIGYLVRGDQYAENVVRIKKFTPTPHRANERDNLRICSLQLGHLDARGMRPLWFNGGPLRDKFLGMEVSPVTSPTHWAVERQSRWDLYGDNIACLHLRPGHGIEVDDEGVITEPKTPQAEHGMNHGDGHAAGAPRMPYVAKDDGGPGGAIPHRLGERERRVFGRLTDWWEEAGRIGVRQAASEVEGDE